MGEAFKIVVNGVDADDFSNIVAAKFEVVEASIVRFELDGAGGGVDLEDSATVQTVVGDVVVMGKVKE